MRIFLFILALTFAVPAYSAENKNSFNVVSIMATASMTEVMSELIREYSNKDSITLSASFDSPEELERRIADGESVDIFISEHPKWINNLKQKGMIDVYSITNLVSNSLVVAASNDNYLAKKYENKANFSDFIRDIGSKAIMVISDPENDPLGVYTKEAISDTGNWDKVSQMSLRASNSSEALFLISSGGSVGITYASDSLLNPEVKIISEVPENKESPIIYQGAVVAGENMEQARKFLDFLKTPSAIKIFKKHGFKPV